MAHKKTAIVVSAQTKIFLATKTATTYYTHTCCSAQLTIKKAANFT